MSNENEIKNYLDDIILCNLESKKRLKKSYGIVSKTIGKYTERVYVISNNREILLLNKTGEILEENDKVWIHYWDNIQNGYVALKVGVNNKPIDFGEPPWNVPTVTPNAYMPIKSDTTINKSYSYSISSPIIHHDLKMISPSLSAIYPTETIIDRDQVFQSFQAQLKMYSGNSIYIDWIDITKDYSSFHVYQNLNLDLFNSGEIIQARYIIETEGEYVVVAKYYDSVRSVIYKYEKSSITAQYGFLIQANRTPEIIRDESGFFINYYLLRACKLNDIDNKWHCFFNGSYIYMGGEIESGSLALYSDDSFFDYSQYKIDEEIMDR
jgi:hypothetical protein